MGQLTPLTSSILQTGQVQRREAGERTRQIRQAKELEKNAALSDDSVDNPVENTGEVEAIHDGKHEADGRNKRKPGKPNQSYADKLEADHIDLTA